MPEWPRSSGTPLQAAEKTSKDEKGMPNAPTRTTYWESLTQQSCIEHAISPRGEQAHILSSRGDVRISSVRNPCIRFSPPIAECTSVNLSQPLRARARQLCLPQREHSTILRKLAVEKSVALKKEHSVQGLRASFSSCPAAKGVAEAFLGLRP